MGACGFKARKPKERGRTSSPKASAKELTEPSSKDRELQDSVEPETSSALSHVDATPKQTSHKLHEDLSKPCTDTSPEMLLPQTNKNYGVYGDNFTINRDLNVKIYQHQTAKEADQNFTGQFTQLQDMLKRRYKTFVMKGLPWMRGIRLTLEKYYVALKLTSTNNIGLELEPQESTIEETFTGADGQEEPFRILVEGGPGFGKTTLAAKLAYDWARDEAYLCQFGIVLFIPLRHFEKGWKETLMSAANLQDDIEFEMILKILTYGSKRLLVIFDGYDELSHESVEEVDSIIQRVVLPDATVVVTSRPGKFTASTEEEGREWFRHIKEVTVDTSQFFNKKILILGFTELMQKEFIVTHTSKFSDPVKCSIIQNIKNMIMNDLLSTEFLQCPLFLLMIILLLTETRNIDMQNLKTRTDLYKKIFNFVIQRYFAKGGDPNAPTIDLFSATEGRTSPHLRVMIQFSHFALNAISNNIYTFSRDELLANCNYICSSERLDSKELTKLGFLTEGMLEEGFHQKAVYEPIHRSLLEFAAAYCIWIAFLEGQQNLWQTQVCALRPSDGFQQRTSTSLVFPFLTGLMNKKAWLLFEALHPFAAEYSSKFKSLKLSLLETEITPKLEASVLPLLPLELHTNDIVTFATSKIHEEILCYGIRQNKTKIMFWHPGVRNSPSEFHIVIESVILRLENPIDEWLSDLSAEGIECQNLWCCFYPEVPSTTDKDWSKGFAYLQKVKFKRISFVIFCGSTAFIDVFEALSKDMLCNDVNYIRYVVEDNSSCVEKLAHLIRGNRIEALELSLHYPNKEDREIFLQLIEKDRTHKHCKSVSQKEIDYLVECSSASTKLVYFIIEGDPLNPLEIDLSLLCNRGHKSWKFLGLNGVKIVCSLKVECPFQISHLEIIDSHVNSVPDLQNNVLCYCNVSSFACDDRTVLAMGDFTFLNNSLTELLLQINDNICHQRFPLDISNLQILVLHMTSFVCDSAMLTAMKTLFPSIGTALRLRGIELLNIEHNHRFIDSFVKNVFYICKPKSIAEVQSESSEPENRLLHLEYLLLHTEILNAEGNFMNETLAQWFPTLARLYLPLKKQLICRLDMLLYVEIRSYIWISDVLYNIFRLSEGFTFEHDFYGMRDNDSIRSKALYGRRPVPPERLSIMFSP